jgi:cell division protease FtsH
MSEKLGPRVLGRNQDMPFLGREMGHEPDYSDEVAREIDEEIRRVIEEAHDGATRVLQEHMDDLHRIAAILIERETIGKDQFERLTAGESEESVFPEETPIPEPAPPEEERKRLPKPKPRPFPSPGRALQPPPPPEPTG